MKADRGHRYRPLTLLLVAVAFLLVLMQTAYLSRQQALSELQHRAEADLARYALTVQQKLDRYKDIPRLLATHSSLRQALQATDAGQIQRTNEYLQQVNTIIGASDSYLMNAAGITVASSNWYKTNSFVGLDFSFRPYFQDALAGRAGRYFALGTTSRKRGYYFSWPVYEGEQVIGVVVVKIDLHEIEQDWNDPLQDIAVTDEDGIIVISTRPEWKFHALRSLPQADLQRILASLRYLDHPLSALQVVRREALNDNAQLITLLEGERISNGALDGVTTREYLLLQRPVPETGLKVSVMARLQPVHEAVLQAVILAGCVYLVLMLLVLFLQARWRIVRERRRFQLRELSALAEREREVRAIINNTRAGLITLDEQGHIESFNPTAEKLFACRADQIRGQAFTQLLSEDAHEHYRRHLSPEARAATDLTLEATGIRGDGSRFPLELTLGRMALGSEHHFIVTVHDMTERKQYEKQLQDARDALETRVAERTADLSRANARLLDEMAQHRSTQNELIQTAKLAVLGQLAAGINHELNQPLAAIRSYADNASAFLQLGKPDRVATNLQEIAGLTERMAKIIHPLKEFSRQSSGQPRPTSLKAVRDGAMSIMYGRLDQKGVELIWPPDLDQVFVLGDTLRLEQVLVNLLANALQAMEQAEVKRIEVTLERTLDRVKLSLHDSGPGIESDDPQRVFEPFYTTKAQGQGLGLGLSISHRIMENLGGRLSAANHPEGGAVFTLELPVATRPEPQQPLPPKEDIA
ncbi:ATP-binding protein [Marinobacterium sediminicola]|uniref:histidine kinase n=1 Tax=Marinobacterium sediminicola TaxID=518898 RepID=A0ABY1S1E4_9GAMM|nr:ATP-binding protein [Marinobacterium sediminicola]ULG69341.1 ATP-binding protein [Marinobacterium sediminicola]SMR75486.1 two-component system, NtrC family, C4-dicarboxylate transport sensor histidine kinase DctB [Marinobacterium sediminicola]